MSENEDKVFLAKLKGSQLLPEKDINSVVKAYQQLKKAGETVHLSDVFLNKGILSSHQIKKLKNSIKEPKVKSLGAYELKEKLGAGGMGAVYLGVHKESKKTFAIKVLSKASGNSNKAVSRFEREFRALTKLKHKNIIGGIEKGFADGYHFYVMDYFEGMSLKDKSKELGQHDFDFIIKVISDISIGLKYAQEKGFIHRDIKPDNIFITKKNNEVKIIDFGLVKSENEDSLGLTQSQTAMGTPHFISCEQAKDAKRADLRSDIYSLGATFYYLITKEFPVKGSTAFEILTALISEEVVPPIKLDKEIPESINAVVMHMMEKDPVDRYQDYSSLLEDLQLISRGKPVTREFTSTIMNKNKSAKWWLDKKRMLPVGLILICLVMAFIFMVGGASDENKTDDKDVSGKNLGLLPTDNHIDQESLDKKVEAPTTEIENRPYSVSDFFNRDRQRKGKTGEAAEKINDWVDQYVSWLLRQKIDLSTSRESILMTRGMLLMALHGAGEFYTGNNKVLMNSHLKEIVDSQGSNGGWGASKGLDVVCTHALVEAYALKMNLEDVEQLEFACHVALTNLRSYVDDIKIDDYKDCPIGLSGLLIDLSMARYADFRKPSYVLNKEVKEVMTRKVFKEIRLVFKEKLGFRESNIEWLVCSQLLRAKVSARRRKGGSKHPKGEAMQKYLFTALQEYIESEKITSKVIYLSLFVSSLSNDKKMKKEMYQFGLRYFSEGDVLKKLSSMNDFKEYGQTNGPIITNSLALLALQNLYKSVGKLRVISSESRFGQQNHKRKSDQKQGGKSKGERQKWRAKFRGNLRNK